MNVTLVKGTNWEVLYVDGKKVLEHTTIDVNAAISALQLGVPVGGVKTIIAQITAPAPTLLSAVSSTEAPVSGSSYLGGGKDEDDEDSDFEEDNEVERWEGDDSDFDDDSSSRENGSGIDENTIGTDSNIDGLLNKIVFGKTEQEKVYEDVIDEADTYNETADFSAHERMRTDGADRFSPKKGDTIYVRAVNSIFEKTSAGKAVVESVIVENGETFIKVEGILTLFNWNIVRNFQDELAEEFADNEAVVL